MARPKRTTAKVRAWLSSPSGPTTKHSTVECVVGMSRVIPSSSTSLRVVTKTRSQWGGPARARRREGGREGGRQGEREGGREKVARSVYLAMSQSSIRRWTQTSRVVSWSLNRVGSAVGSAVGTAVATAASLTHSPACRACTMRTQ